MHIATSAKRRWTAAVCATEIDLDARLKADLGSMDADDDGFVSDAEYRVYYRTD